MPRFHHVSPKKGQDRISLLGISPKSLPKVTNSPRPNDADRKGKKTKTSFKLWDNLKYRCSDKYNKNRAPRELLASIVDDFNSGNPELDFGQRQLVTVLGKYINRNKRNT